MEAFYIVGGVVALLGIFNLLKALSRRRWPETIGRIQKNEQSEISTHINSWFHSGMFSKHSARPIEDSGKKKVLRLSYVYVVEGYKYVCDQLYSAPVKTPKNRISGLIEGDKVKVFYHPGNPHKAFLAHSFAWPSLVVVGLGVAVAFLGFYLQFHA